MGPKTYSAYNLAGGVLWVGSLLYAGYFFGNIPWIKGNLTAIIIAIIAVSLLPLVIAFVKSRLASKNP
jgi:membrane-associated protein